MANGKNEKDAGSSAELSGAQRFESLFSLRPLHCLCLAKGGSQLIRSLP